jgi:hypothetical protein
MITVLQPISMRCITAVLYISSSLIDSQTMSVAMLSELKPTGNTGLLSGIVIGKAASVAVNDRFKECVKVKESGDSMFEVGKVVRKEAFEEERARLEAEGKATPTWPACAGRGPA